MAHQYRYQRPSEHLEYYTVFERQDSPPPPDNQPPLVHDFIPVRITDMITFEPNVTDIRQYPVNAPNGDTIGTVVGYLADATNNILPFAYVHLAGERTVVVPTDQLTIFPEQCLTTLEGGIEALNGAPDAKYDRTDAERAAHYWGDYRWRNAA